PRLRWRGGAAGAGRARACARLDRLRRQRGLPRRFRRAPRARSAAADARRDAPLRPPLHLARERGGTVGRAAALVLRARAGERADAVTVSPRAGRAARPERGPRPRGSTRARSAQPRQRLVIGVRRSRPNAFGRSRTPGGAWRRLYSARSTSATARRTTSGSKPSEL